MLVMHDEDREEGRIRECPEPKLVNLLRSPGIDSQSGRIDSLESIPGLLKRLQIQAQKYWIKHMKLSFFCLDELQIVSLIDWLSYCRLQHRAPTPYPLLLRVVESKNHFLNEEITPLLPTEIGERFSQTISNLGHAALLRRCELPHNESA
jgi:hypothetical protein